MIRFFIFLLMGVSGLGVCVVSAQANELRCRYVHLDLDRTSKGIVAFDTGTGNTTSLRTEDKYVLMDQGSGATTKSVIDNLKQVFGSAIKSRDEKIQGRKNITMTEYLKPLEYSIGSASKLKFKVRFRKYLVQDENQPILSDDMVRAQITKDSQYLELKIDHPDYESTVIKPRLRVSDLDVMKIHSRELFMKEKNSIAARLRKMNPDLQGDVSKFIEVIEAVFESQKSDVLEPYLQTAYVRESYSIKLLDSAGKTVEVQVTVDREIDLKNLASKKSVRAYIDGSSVIEVKIPVKYAGLSDADVAAVPGLQQIRNLLAELKSGHLEAYQQGSGKLFHAKRVL